MAISWINTYAVYVSAPGSGGTQVILKPSESLKHSKHNCPQTRPLIHIKCWMDTFVLCLTWGMLQCRVPGAQKATTNLWVLGVVCTKHTINPSSEPAPAALEPHVGPEGTLVPSCGHLLSQPLSGFPPLSGSAAAMVDWPWALCGLGSLPPISGNTKMRSTKWAISLSKTFRGLMPTYAMPLHSNTQLPSLQIMTAFFFFLVSWTYVFMMRCVYIWNSSLFLDFPPIKPSFMQENLTSFLSIFLSLIPSFFLNLWNPDKHVWVSCS